MGVYIFLDIMPNHIGEKEWDSVYGESLQLINAYPFMDKIVDKVTYDESWVYVDRSKQRELPYSSDVSLIGWHIFGDLESMMTAESIEVRGDEQNLKKRESLSCHGSSFFIIILWLPFFPHFYVLPSELK